MGSGLQLHRWEPSDGAYPQRLATLQEACALWVRTSVDPEHVGDELWCPPAVAIVGTRTATATGCDVTRDIAWGLARAGVIIVSGMALGIDAAAHEGALLAGGRTIAVVGCGLDRCYPSEHAELAGDIARRGALVSEWAPGVPPAGWRFPRRNRLISGLADAVVFVEGGARSGAIHTVKFALDQGRDVLVVPRDPACENSRAPNRLLRAGARPVASAADVLEELAGDGLRGKPDLAGELQRLPEAERSGGRRPAGSPDAGYSTLGRRVLERLGRSGGTTTEALLQKLPGEVPERVLSELTRLEVEGHLFQDGRGRWRINVA